MKTNMATTTTLSLQSELDFTEQIESLKKDLEQVKKDKDYYVNSYCKEMDRVADIKKQIESIGVLLDLIQKS